MEADTDKVCDEIHDLLKHCLNRTAPPSSLESRTAAQGPTTSIARARLLQGQVQSSSASTRRRGRWGANPARRAGGLRARPPSARALFTVSGTARTPPPADCAPGLHLLVPYSRQQLLALCRC
jgi:hypothetical protein